MPYREKGTVTLKGRSAGDAATQHALAAGATLPLTIGSGYTELAIIVESGSVRIRSDGSAATSVTGLPWMAPYSPPEPFACPVSIYAVTAAVVTVEQR